MPFTSTSPDVTSIDPRMGTFCWWDLDASQVTPEHLRDVLASEGLTDISVPDIDPVSAIRKAAGNWATGRGNNDRYKAEVTAIDGGRVYVGILQHRREGSREVAWGQTETLCYDTVSREWVNAYPSEVGQGFIKSADDFLKYLDHRFLRPSVLVPQLEAASAISLRRQGGIYFAPLASLDIVKRLKRIVGQLGGCKFHLCMVENDGDSREGVGAGVQDHVLGQLLDVEKQLEDWRTTSRKIRTDSQANVLGQLATLLGLADLYEKTLEVSLQDLRAKVTECQDEAMRLLAVSK
jgi:hypothetical protein